MAEIVESYGRWLMAYRWDLFCTLTTRYDRPTINGCSRMFRELMADTCGPDAFAFCAIERAGRYHMHALLGGTHVPTSSISRYWQKHGRAEVLKYDPDMGGAFYIAKGIPSGKCETLILGKWPDRQVKADAPR